MNDHQPETTPKEGFALSPQSNKLCYSFFLVLGFIVVITPPISAPILGPGDAFLIACAILLVWFQTMPTGCINGGMIWSIIAMGVLFNPIILAIMCIIRYFRQ